MANNTVTINKIIAMFKDLSIRHDMINDFGYGNTYDIGASRTMLFPYLWLEPTTTRILMGQTNAYRVMVYGFNIYLMDKVEKGDGNYQDTLSDTNFILNTVLTELSQHQYYIDMNVSMDGDISADPVVFSTDDYVNGWMATISLKVPLRYTPCNTPIQPIAGWTSSLTSGSQSISQYILIGDSIINGFTVREEDNDPIYTETKTLVFPDGSISQLDEHTVEIDFGPISNGFTVTDEDGSIVYTDTTKLIFPEGSISQPDPNTVQIDIKAGIVLSDTYDTIVELMNAGELVPGAYYEINDYQTIYFQPATFDLKTADIEPLILLATSESTFSTIAYSGNDFTVNPESQGYIEYNININEISYDSGSTTASVKGLITYRTDNKNNSAPYDHTKVEMVRYYDSITGDYTSYYDQGEGFHDGILTFDGYNNVIEKGTLYDYNYNQELLSNNVIDGNYNKIGVGGINNTIMNSNTVVMEEGASNNVAFGSSNNTLGKAVSDCLLYSNASRNVIGDLSYSIILEGASNNTFGTRNRNSNIRNSNQTVVGDNNEYISITNGCSVTSIGNNNSGISMTNGTQNTVIGSRNSSITFSNMGGGYQDNNIGDNNQSITISFSGSGITIGNKSNYIQLENSSNVTIGDYNVNMQITNGDNNTIGTSNQNITISNSNNNTLENLNNTITFTSGAGNNNIGNNNINFNITSGSQFNTVGDNCTTITFNNGTQKCYINNSSNISLNNGSINCEIENSTNIDTKGVTLEYVNFYDVDTVSATWSGFARPLVSHSEISNVTGLTFSNRNAAQSVFRNFGIQSSSNMIISASNSSLVATASFFGQYNKVYTDIVPTTYLNKLGITGGSLRFANLTTEPNGSNGDVYYNSTNNRFRKYQSGTWSNFGDTGATGADGSRGAQFTSYDEFSNGNDPNCIPPFCDVYNNGQILDDLIVGSLDGNYWSWNGSSWVLQGSLMGPQGPQGPIGPSATYSSTRVPFAGATGSLISSPTFTYSGTASGIGTMSSYGASFSQAKINTIYDGSNRISVDTLNRIVYDSSSTTSIFYGLREATDSAGITSINWNSRQLLFPSSVLSLDFGSGYASDTSGITSIDWVNRTLNSLDGNARINYRADISSGDVSALQLIGDGDLSPLSLKDSGSLVSSPSSGQIEYNGEFRATDSTGVRKNIVIGNITSGLFVNPDTTQALEVYINGNTYYLQLVT